VNFINWLKWLQRRLKKYQRQIYHTLLIIFIILNTFSYIGAYALTHYTTPGHLGLGETRPINKKSPKAIELEYTIQRIPINQTEWLETWFIPVSNSFSKGTVLLFPGKGSSKGRQLLAPAQAFHNLGYNTLLVDFRGVGGSSGNTTTVGMKEAKDVAIAFNYALKSNFQKPLILHGISMGSVAILKAVAQENIYPQAIILELPFARFLDTVRSRLREVSLPTFPMAELIVFWGSVQHRVNGFRHNPVTYANQIKCPTLLFHGKLDRWTSVAEIEEIAHNLHFYKRLIIFPTAGHAILVSVDKKSWYQNVNNFLELI
jgi:uncharacterized protein